MSDTIANWICVPALLALMVALVTGGCWLWQDNHNREARLAGGTAFIALIVSMFLFMLAMAVGISGQMLRS